MPGKMRDNRRLRWQWLLVVLLSVLGLQAYADTLRMLSAHVVVQFTEGVTQPDTAEFIDELATRVGAPLAYVRPAGSKGHLILIRHLKNSAQLDEVVAALGADQQIVTVQPRGKLEPERH
ncbi:MAG: hypothetical protein OEW08_08675 [Gammaproteobacteria bacterium]|nr:hypothetical protein [Gammaproteobacteria bacterium]